MLVAVAVEMSEAQMSKLQLSSVKVSAAVVTGAGAFFCPALDAAKKLHSLLSECLKVFLF